MKYIKGLRLFFFLLICFILLSCNKKNILTGNSLIVNNDVVKEIREYYLKNKESLSNEYILNITSLKQHDTIVLSISYSLNLASVLEVSPSLFGYIDTIPYMYLTGNENICKYDNNGADFNVFVSHVFEKQYERYVIKNENFPPPPTGVCEILRLFILNNKIVLKENDNNIIKNTHEIYD